MEYFIFGGAFNGKYDRILQLGFKKDDILDCKSDNIKNIKNTTCVYNAQELLKNCCEKDVEFIINCLKKAKAVVCNDISCGVVPLDKEQRIYRTNVGTLCCELSKYAKIVERVYFGIPMVIKNENNIN